MIGFDLVGMVVDDIVVVGVELLFMIDYIVCGWVVFECVVDVVCGIVEVCVVVGCVFIGGEIVEYFGLFGFDEYDVVGVVMGVVEVDDVFGFEWVCDGDVLVVMVLLGLYFNGYFFVCWVLDVVGWIFEWYVDELGCIVGEELFEFMWVYVMDVFDFVCVGWDDGIDVYVLSYVMGGGLVVNFVRVLL